MEFRNFISIITSQGLMHILTYFSKSSPHTITRLRDMANLAEHVRFILIYFIIIWKIYFNFNSINSKGFVLKLFKLLKNFVGRGPNNKKRDSLNKRLTHGTKHWRK